MEMEHETLDKLVFLLDLARVQVEERDRRVLERSYLTTANHLELLGYDITKLKRSYDLYLDDKYGIYCKK